MIAAASVGPERPGATVPVAARPLPPRARRHAQVADGLRRVIMLGETAPGAALLELELAGRFGCSQGVIREALLLLQEEGLVQRSGHRGTRVSDLNPEEAVEMLRLRRDLECRAARRACARPAGRPGTLRADLETQLALMEAAAGAGDPYALAQADREFHRRLFAEAGWPGLEPMLLRCLTHNHRFKLIAGPADLAHTAQRHLGILEAAESRDGPALAAALAHHVATILDDGPSLLDDEA
ncbi:GntR family transcriptional regulator [Methylobacterium nonmethylotrophicum]|uniref:GntR family transcriptional regulator n=2 Tax=Methylobacterium nonmethylotrophicum TaxID=1141884 RepID=A0A4Z0NST1_9HYPH|nr:GntR family transcriptional regulator [Methylobacterium nonmethylotrophicum]